MLDQQPQYHSLALAGADLSLLHRARSPEIARPLGLAVTLSVGFCLLMLAPFASSIGAATVVRMLVTVVACSAMLLGSVALSRPLVRAVCRF